jgi:two-component system, OmpR family, sensor histidine kinase BaeS
VVVVVAVRRLNLYEDAFGLTMLRLYSELFSYWIGAVFLFLGAALAGVGHGRGWFVGAAVATGLALLLALNVANPEAIVARDQLAGTRQVQRPDVVYVARLSADAIPTAAARLPGLDPVARADLRVRLCAAEPDGVPPSRFIGWAAWNLGHERAERAITRTCG